MERTRQVKLGSQNVGKNEVPKQLEGIPDEEKDKLSEELEQKKK